MVTRNEQQAPSRDFHSGEVWSLAEMLRLAGCLLILMGIAVAAATIDTAAETHRSALVTSGSATQHAAVVESRIGLDADRTRMGAQSIAPQSQSAR